MRHNIARRDVSAISWSRKIFAGAQTYFRLTDRTMSSETFYQQIVTFSEQNSSYPSALIDSILHKMDIDTKSERKTFFFG